MFDNVYYLFGFTRCTEWLLLSPWWLVEALFYEGKMSLWTLATNLNYKRKKQHCFQRQ